MKMIRPQEELTFTLVAIYRSWKRKTRALQTVTHQPKLSNIDQKNFVDRIKKIHSLAIRTNSLVEKTESFWKMENLTSEYLKLVGEDLDLRDPAIPVETLPITHCGAGIAAVEVSGFDLEKITLLIDSVSHPDYRLFCFEGIGAMLGVYEPGFFLLISTNHKVFPVHSRRL